ncbi:leucine zipper domain-containing protein [Streptomyces triculaminicus]|uniref:helix-turn-helix domain-containing protein n=1 Tax=Streptomyces triculaminicus TaxID=2816232 RepID=UPI0033CAA930
MYLRVDAGRPIAHVAAEAGICRRCLATWYARWLAHGGDSLMDRSSRPIASPNRTRRGHRRSGRGAAAPDQVRARPARHRT